MSSDNIGYAEDDASRPAPPSPPDNLEQVKLLFDYTKFHIGLYTTLVSFLVTVLASNFAQHWSIIRPLLAVGIVAIVVAGFAGGVIAASLPGVNTKESLWEQKIGPWSARRFCWELKKWTYLEHTAFWVAIFLTLGAFGPVLVSQPLPSGLPDPWPF